MGFDQIEMMSVKNIHANAQVTAIRHFLLFSRQQGVRQLDRYMFRAKSNQRRPHPPGEFRFVK
jgi:hypothetical protein